MKYRDRIQARLFSALLLIIIIKSPKQSLGDLLFLLRFLLLLLLLFLFFLFFFFPCTMNLSMADLRNYRTEFHQTSWKFWKRRIAPLMVTYHYVKFYVSIIIQLEVININVRNFKFPIGWCPELIPDIDKFLPVAIFKMATTIPHKFNIVRFLRHLICG
jgi:hypothetical protein